MRRVLQLKGKNEGDNQEAMPNFWTLSTEMSIEEKNEFVKLRPADSKKAIAKIAGTRKNVANSIKCGKICESKDLLEFTFYIVYNSKEYCNKLYNEKHYIES